MKLYNLTPVASIDDLRVFHSEDYLQFLSSPDPDLEEDFGCGKYIENYTTFLYAALWRHLLLKFDLLWYIVT